LTLLLIVTVLVVSLYGTIKKQSPDSWQNRRAQMLKQLKQIEGKHLVIVSYGPQHSFHDEWVYNEADIDGAKVVFAHAMNSAQDCQLAEYFKCHQIWSLEVDGDESVPKLRAYPPNLCE